MSSITFADLSALAIDTSNLPPMRESARRTVARSGKRSEAARREALARKAIRAAKTATE